MSFKKLGITPRQAIIGTTDTHRKYGADVLNIGGSSERDLLQEELGLASPPPPPSVAEKSFTSGKSSISGGGVNIDPAVEARRQQGLQLAEGSLAATQQNRESIGSGEAFIRSRTDPLRESILAQKQAQIERQQNTGISESAFGAQSRENLDISSKQALDQGTLSAFDDFVKIGKDFDSSEASSLKLLEAVRTTQFAQDAKARGMSADLLSQLKDIDLRAAGLKGDEAAAKRSKAGGILSIFANFFSSRTFKDSNKPLDNQQVLSSMMELDIEKWKYIGDDTEHIGCYAEDFNERFGNKDDKEISVIDIIGVLMASVQAQQEQIKALREKVNA